LNFGIDNRVALVTAASKGLGKGTAHALAREGARVAISARTLDTLEAAAAEIRADTGAQVLASQSDVSAAADIGSLIERVTGELGPVEILVVNTGGPKFGSFDSVDDDDWYEAFALVQLSAIRLIRHVLPEMRRRGWGRIVAIESSSVKQPVPNLTLSNGIRPGVAGMLKSLVLEVAKDGITINTVLPGVFMTPRIIASQQTQAEAAGRTLDEQLIMATDGIPVGQLGDPADMGNVIAFLASEQARYVTGSVIQVDGGMIRSVV
jgi:3-oxoacyl-[acyl-carrier protein] reductase